MKLSKSLALLFSSLFFLLISACGGGSGGGSDSGGTGTLSVSLTDSAGSYKAVYITIESVEVHTGGNDNNNKNWQTIPMDIDTINLCDLTNGVFEELGSVRLTEGKYTQLRLHLNNTPEDGELNILSVMHPYANYVILEDNSQHELKVPSGFQSGVKVVKGFTISKDGTTEIILDFDAMSSVVEAGNSDKWLLKPTIKVGELREYSIINGRVTKTPAEGIEVTDSTDVGIEGAYVSAQIYDADAQDEDKVVIQAGTITDDEGYYSLFVKPGIYNLVVSADGKEFAFKKIETSAGEEILENSEITDFQLADSTNTLTNKGNIFINGADDNQQYATISYRKEVSCPACEMIEIKSINILNTNPYEVELPGVFDSAVVDSYERVASTFGYDTLIDELDFSIETTIEDNIELTISN